MEQGCESSHCVSLMPSVYVCVKCMGKLNGGGPSYQLHGFSRFMWAPPPQKFDCQWAAGGILWAEASETAKHPQCTVSIHAPGKSQRILSVPSWVTAHDPDEKFLLEKMGNVTSPMRISLHR